MNSRDATLPPLLQATVLLPRALDPDADSPNTAMPPPGLQPSTPDAAATGSHSDATLAATPPPELAARPVWFGRLGLWAVAATAMHDAASRTCRTTPVWSGRLGLWAVAAAGRCGVPHNGLIPPPFEKFLVPSLLGPTRPSHETLALRMPFRPGLLPPLRHFSHRVLPPLRKLFFHSTTAVTESTESEKDALVPCDDGVRAPRVGWRGGVSGEGSVGLPINAAVAVAAAAKGLIAKQFAFCHELLREGRRREMRSCLAQMVTEQGSRTAPTLCDILWHEFKEWDSNGVVWDDLANAYARAQMIHDALYALGKMNSLNIWILVSTYDSLLYSPRMTNMALELFQEMESSSVCPSEYSHGILIDGLCKQDKVGKALSFLQEVREEGKFKPLGMTFNILMSALCNLGFTQAAKSFLCLMLKYGLNLDRYTYSTLIHGLCKVGSMDEALDLFERLTKEGMQLEVVTYNSLINGYRLLGLTSAVAKVIQMMRHRGLEPDIVTYTILIASHCESGDVEEGMKIRKDIIDQGLHLNIVTYSVLLNALFKKGLFDEVENLLGEIHNIGLDMDVIAYSILIHGYCKLGEIERALRVCNIMCCSQRVMPTSLNHASILLGLCKKGLLVEARWYLETVASKYQPTDVVLYNIVIDGYAKVGDIDNAIHLYEQIIIAGTCPTIVTCNSLLYGYCRIGDLKMAQNYFSTIRLSGMMLTAVTYTTMMDALSEAGKVETMLGLFDEMVRKGIEPNAVTYSVVIKGLCKQLRFRNAINILHDMHREGVNADPITYNTLIQGFCEAQNIQMAFRVHDIMVQCGLEPTPVTYNLLINALCLKGKITDAEMLLSFLIEKGIQLRKFAFTTLIKAQCAKGMPYKAMALFNKFLDVGIGTSVEDFSAAINRLCKRHFVREAFMFIPIMLSVGIYSDSQLYWVLSGALRKRSEFSLLAMLQALSVKSGGI